MAVIGAMALARRSREPLTLCGISFGLTFVMLASLRMDAGTQNSFATNLYQFVPPFIGFGSGLLLDLASRLSSIRAQMVAIRIFGAAGVGACLWLVAVPGV
jgi:hypothetical protein